nr:unnamed protein product [Leishmania braziliensis]
MEFTDRASPFSQWPSLCVQLDAIWRFFRVLALKDGFNPPGDKPRFLINTVNIQGLWSNWHASFNLWIVQYMYILIGGSDTKFLCTRLTFFIIAI